jgi:hypothetical protein
MSRILEIEIDNEHCKGYAFHPAERRVAGRMDFRRYSTFDRHALKGIHEFGADCIPGEVVGYDPAKGVGYIRTRLHEPTFSGLAAAIKRKGFALPPEERTEFPLPTDDARNFWLWHMKLAIDTKAATLVKGDIPRDIPAPKRKAAMGDGIDRLASMIGDLIAALRPARATA